MEEIDKFVMLFECYNHPDRKLTQKGRQVRDEFYETVRTLYEKINKVHLSD